MKKFRLLVSVLAGTFFYVIMSMIGGRDGIWAFSQMREQKQAISAHTALITKTNDQLTLEKLSLQQDLDVIACYAKKLGFVGEGEKLVKITGFPPRETQIYDAGSVVRHAEVKFIPESVCKGTGFLILLLVYLVSLLMDYQKGLLRVKNPAVKKNDGLKIYEIS